MLERGQVVEFIDDGRFVTAVCLDFKKDKPRLLTHLGRETVIPARRLIDTSGPVLATGLSRDETMEQLRNLSLAREELAEGMDLLELWSLLEEDGQGQVMSPEYLAGFFFSDPATPDQISALIRAILADRIYFRYKSDGVTVNPQEKVEELQSQRLRDQELAREKTEIGTWLARVWAGSEAAPPDNMEEVVERLIDVALNGPESTQIGRVKDCLQEAGIRSSNAAFKLLVKLGRFEADEDLDLRRLQIPTVFPNEVQEQARSRAEEGLDGFDWSDRTDLTGMDVFTIDGASTRDFDDALSYETDGWEHLVQVHITDISPFIQEGSDLDLEARSRASSLYLPDKRLPMLPEVLSEGLFSLQEGQLRPALSMKVRLDSEGNVLSRELLKSRIAVSRRLVYRDVDQSLDHDPQMAQLAHLAEILKAKRIQEGAMVLDVPEVVVWPGPDRVEIDRIENTTPSRLLVAEMMILANRLCAEILSEAGYAAPFRCQDPPKHVFEAPEGADPLWVTLRRRMLFSPLEISPSCGPHAGLGLKAYTTFTSPIRRYHDLITIRQLNSFLNGGKPVYDQASLEEMQVALTPIMRSHNRLKFRRQRYWLLKYLAQDKDRPLEAIVLRRIYDKFSLVLLDTMLRVSTPVLPETALREGERVMVRIAKVDPLDDILRIELV